MKSKCINVRSGHGSKGHQTRNGAIFAAGEYVSTFNFDTYGVEFQDAVYFRLFHLMSLLAVRTSQGQSAEGAAHDIHQHKTLIPFYNESLRGKTRPFHCHSICLGCLIDRPDHVLPCGHILCTSCVLSFGLVKSKNHVEIQKCPLEGKDNRTGQFQPVTVFLKPDTAASRILVLDGGGIRSVIQLEILRLLEAEFKGRLSLQYFFDLIVGTGTGGIIALGLTTHGWSAEKCTYYLERICGQAFARKSGLELPGVGRLLQSYSKSKFSSENLETVLKNSLTDNQLLFGGPRGQNEPTSPAKVAVTATASNGNMMVLGNYNRRCSERRK
jgi:Patatin-like phospholipase